MTNRELVDRLQSLSDASKREVDSHAMSRVATLDLMAELSFDSNLVQIIAALRDSERLERAEALLRFIRSKCDAHDPIIDAYFDLELKPLYPKDAP